MYILPRIIGIGTYVLLLFLFTFLIAHSKKKNYKIFLIIYLLLLSFIAFNNIPDSGKDLYRLIPLLKLYSSIPIKKILFVAFNSNMPILVLYYFFIGKLNNPGFLAGITVFICFGILFYILFKLSKRYDIKSSKFAFILFWLMSTGIFGCTIDNVRTTLVLSILTLCIYREYFEGKNFINNIILYLCASLTHAIGLAVTLLRIIFLILEKSKNLKSKFFKIIFLILFILFTGLFMGRQIIYIINKTINYFSQNSYSYFWEIIIAFINLLMCFIIIKLLKRRNDNLNESYNLQNCVKLIEYFIIISFVSLFFDYNTFYRLNLFICMLIPMISIPTLSENCKIESYKNKQFVKLIIVCAIMFLLTCTRGNLCSLKFFE